MTQAHPRKAVQADPFVTIEIMDRLPPADLNDLCDATDAAIEGGGGFGWVSLPAREVLERYWKGVLVVPERHLLLARMDGVVCGAAQLVEPSRHNEAQSFSAQVLASFVAPWARNRGAGRKLVETAEKLALEMGYKVLHLDVRETQEAAIRLYESMGYRRWGVNPAYAFVNNRAIAGYYYTKVISPLFTLKDAVSG
ncbi:MAG: GNAT family N-acetyltransferase [Alphaproteobacteria bacterium]|nr:MAG: GNAT family N-acetyltransferase [Alphaproteobacteria bacterium]